MAITDFGKMQWYWYAYILWENTRVDLKWTLEVNQNKREAHSFIGFLSSCLSWELP